MSVLLYTFRLVILSSVTASAIAVIILMLKFILKDRLGVRWSYCIWMLLIIRLIMPYNPESSVSIFNIFKLDSDYIYFIEYSKFPQSEISNNVAVESNKKLNDNLEIDSTNSSYSLLKIGSIIWLLGVIMWGSYAAISTLLFMWKLRTQSVTENEKILKVISQIKVKLKINRQIIVLSTDLIKTPAVLGFIRPKLLLPKEITHYLSYDNLKYIVLHELCHLKRRDTFVSCLLGVLRILHWFNPILWYSFYRIRQDYEPACDALALTNLDQVEYKNYGKTLLKILEIFSMKKQVYGLACVLGERSQLKRRITMISSFQKSSYRISALAIILFITLGCIMLTNAKGEVNHISNSTYVEDEIQISKSEDNSKPTEQQIRNWKEVDERLDNIWKEISTSYNIDESQYVKLDTTEKFNRFLDGKLQGFNDQGLIDLMVDIFIKDLMDISIGSSKPEILLNKNCQEIIFANKDSNGRNILQIFTKKDEGYNKEVLIKEGKVISEMKEVEEFAAKKDFEY